VLSPVRTVHRLLGRWSLRDSYPAALGYWPAVAGLFAFVWLELASPDPGSLAAIRIWLLIYLAITLAGALWFSDRWFSRGDPFEHLPSLPVRPGTVTLLAVLLGSTAYDSFSAMPRWRDFVDEHAGSTVSATVIRTAGLLVFVGVVAGTFWLAARATGGVDRA